MPQDELDDFLFDPFYRYRAQREDEGVIYSENKTENVNNATDNIVKPLHKKKKKLSRKKKFHHQKFQDLKPEN